MLITNTKKKYTKWNSSCICKHFNSKISFSCLVSLKPYLFLELGEDIPTPSPCHSTVITYIRIIGKKV